MQKQDLLNQINMSYEEQVNYLLDKYGHAEHDYFLTKRCDNKNKKVSRTAEGLFCHHIREDVADLLCYQEFAIIYPFEYQKAENLVYCNALEHLLLHIKISVMRSEKEHILMPGVFFIVHQINSMILYKGGEKQWEKNCYAAIKDNRQEYLMLLSIALKHVDKAYYAKTFLSLGQTEDGGFFVNIADGLTELVKEENEHEQAR